MNNFVLVTLDSCRYDSVENVWKTLTALPAIGDLQEAYTFATWTQPAHLNFMTGRLPWVTGRTIGYSLRAGGHEFHSDLGLWNRRLGTEVGQIFDNGFCIEPRLRELGYKLHAIVSARPIGKDSHFSKLFDSHHDVGRRGDTLLRAIPCLNFKSQPVFLILNLCETHYPYWDGDYSPRFENRWVAGLGGQGRAASTGQCIKKSVFTKDELTELHQRQQRAVQYVDKLLPRLFERLPPKTYLTITADHGECFGESGQFGHGEVSDSVVLRVPYIEGMVPKLSY